MAAPNPAQYLIDSTSLWNYTKSPGWTEEEIEILKLGLMKFGVGRWKRIKSRLLPAKSNSQLNLQTQRILGQQSLGEFMNLHIDPDKVKADNLKKQGPGILRKNNYIIYTGDKIDLKEKIRKKKENKKKYGLSIPQIKNIEIPLLNQEIFNPKNKYTPLEKIFHLERLQHCAEQKLQKIKENELHAKKIIIDIIRYNDSQTQQIKYAAKDSLKLIINKKFIQLPKYQIENEDHKKFSKQQHKLKNKRITINLEKIILPNDPNNVSYTFISHHISDSD